MIIFCCVFFLLLQKPEHLGFLYNREAGIELKDALLLQTLGDIDRKPYIAVFQVRILLLQKDAYNIYSLYQIMHNSTQITCDIHKWMARSIIEETTIQKKYTVA